MREFEREEIDSDEEMTFLLKRFRKFVKSHKKRMTPSKKKGEAMIATWRDSEVEVVEGFSTSLDKCENNYFTFSVSYQEETQDVTKCVSLEDFKIGDLKLGNRRGACLRDASLEEMTLTSSSERCFDHGSSCSENSCVNLVDNQEFIDSLQKSLKEKENDILRLEKDNLQLSAKMTHLDDEVRCVKDIKGKLKMELEEARTSLAKMTLGSDMDDSLKVDIVVVSKYEKEIEDCHQRMKAMKDELACKENSLRIFRDKEKRHLQELKKGKILQPQAQGKCKASPPHHPRRKIGQVKMPTKDIAQPHPPRATHPSFALPRPNQPRKQNKPVLHQRRKEPVQPQRCLHPANAPKKSLPVHYHRQPHQQGNASMRAQSYGMNSSFIPTCHYCGMIGHIRPKCFNFIEKCMMQSMIERKRLRRAYLHVPRKSFVYNPRILHNMQSLSTRKKIISPKWIRKNNEPACYETNKSHIGSTESNGLGRSIGPHDLPC